ncbi:MAG TPA: class I SAM-dependent methyltransferase [Gammaproteobacteria bacterium]|nr:class I SAM-dependent methyltransferase [Gammaproteobacteria bacterium]
MSGFTAEWLGLREPFDAAVRASSLVAELATRLDRSIDKAPLEILDLGAGAGSNFRHLAPLIGGLQRWRLADNDPKLLDAGLTATHAWAGARGAEARRARNTLSVAAVDLVCFIETELVDLSDLVSVELPDGGLVTAAALLDLVSYEWLDTLAQRCRAARSAVAFALTYDGRTTAEPAEPEDAMVVSLFNRHQLLDKGLGPALGPRAAGAAEAAFQAQGYELRVAPSDWVIGSKEHAMQLALLDGWLGAALEIAPESRATLTSWFERRRAHLLGGRSELRVGHVDLVGWL